MEFKTIEGAEKAIEMMNRFEIGDRKIIVREETLRDQERMSHMEFDGPAGGHEPVGGPSGGGGIGRTPVAPGPPMAASAVAAINPSVAAMTTVTPMMLERMGIKGPLTDSLYISNLDYKIDWKRLKDMFKVAGRVLHATVKQDEEGRSRGIAIVRFEHPYEALLAYVLFNGQVFNDRPIRVKIDREGAHVQPNLPIFPPTAGGAAAAASFLTHLANKTGGGGGGGGGGMNAFQSLGGVSPLVMPQQSEAAAAALAAFLGGGSNGASNMPAAAAVGSGQFRPPLPPPAAPGPSGTADLLSSFLNQQQQQQPAYAPPMTMMMAGMNNPLMVGQRAAGAAAAAVGFPMSGVNPAAGSGMHPLGQLMGLQGGMGTAAGSGAGGSPNFNMAPPDRGGMSRDNTSAMAGLQQLLMAAAAGGMSQEQIASAALSLGLGRDVTSGGGARFSGMVDSGDRYAGRGVNGLGKSGPPGHPHDPYPRRPPRGGDYERQQQSMPSDGGGSQRGFSRHRLGDGGGGSRPMPRHHMAGDQRSADSSRMYMKRPGDGY